jgi:cytochrome c-type biogenesis protein CcmE
MKITSKHIVIVVLILAVGFLVYDSVSNYINPYVTVSQVISNKNYYQGKVVQILGIVVNGTLSRGSDGITKFDISDGTQVLPVVYKGIAVQNLSEGKEVAVQGVLSSNIIEASQILVKCPSKYEENPGTTTNHYDWLFIAAIVIALGAASFFVYSFFWKRS